MELDCHGGEFCAEQKRGLTRREFIAVVGTVTGGLALGFPKREIAAAEEPSPVTHVAVTLSVNGKRHDLNFDPRITLLDLLREDFGPYRNKKRM